MADEHKLTPFPMAPSETAQNRDCCSPEPQRRDASDFDCCGGQAPEGASPWERPGYSVAGYVEDFFDTPAGPVPRITPRISPADRLGTIRVRLGIGRENYRVSPGLYAIGSPDGESPVLVTANYKLTFDTLRRRLSGMNFWLLVVDTCGINVWCAAGKGTFSAEEVARRVVASGLEKVVVHRELVLPQLSATGVSAAEVRRRCGFSVIWGPVRAEDIGAFFRNGKKAPPAARRVTFPLAERVVLIPVELAAVPKPSLVILAALFILSGIGPWIFSFAEAGTRGLTAAAAYLAGVAAGGIFVPILLPWLPGRLFSLKGALVGGAAGLIVAAAVDIRLGVLGVFAVVAITASVASYLAMNFTGATPFTSPSGVEKEMRRAIPFQAGAALVAVAAWIGSAFVL